MKLNEFQGKELLKKAGIAIPRGEVATSPREVGEIAGRLPNGPYVVKAQILSGGRGKAGLIQIASSAPEAEKISVNLLGKTHKGYRVEKVLVEEKLDIQQELYMSFLTDSASGKANMLFSRTGGVEIEATAEKNDEAILRFVFPEPRPLMEYQFRKKLCDVGFQGAVLHKLSETAFKLCRLFFEFDLSLAEINPLVILKDGTVVAADAKLEVDNNALFRHPELGFARQELTDPMELSAYDIGVTYVQMDGTVGVIASGAGLAMNTMDILAAHGAAAANFLETGGGINAVMMESAVKLLMECPQVEGLIINLYGGVNPMVAAAEGIVAGYEKSPRKVPTVVKILGNQQVEAWKIVEDAGFETVKNVHTEKAIELLLKKMAAEKASRP